MKKIHKYSILLIMFFVFTMARIVPAIAAIQVSPDLFEFKIEEKSNKKFITGSFTVKTLDKDNIRFKIYPESFDISPEGTMIVKENPVNNVLIDNIRFSPNEFEIKPGKSQVVRFTINNLNSLPDGESRLVLFLEDTKTRELILKSENKNIQPKIILKTRVGIPIYIDNGKTEKNGIFENLSIKENKGNFVYLANVKSTGNSKIRLFGKGQIIENKKLISEFKIKNQPVQAGSTGTITDIIPTEKLTPQKEYKLKMIFSFENHNFKNIHLIKEACFTYEKPNNN